MSENYILGHLSSDPLPQTVVVELKFQQEAVKFRKVYLLAVRRPA